MVMKTVYKTQLEKSCVGLPHLISSEWIRSEPVCACVKQSWFVCPACVYLCLRKIRNSYHNGNKQSNRINWRKSVQLIGLALRLRPSHRCVYWLEKRGNYDWASCTWHRRLSHIGHSAKNLKGQMQETSSNEPEIKAKLIKCKSLLTNGNTWKCDCD